MKQFSSILWAKYNLWIDDKILIQAWDRIKNILALTLTMEIIALFTFLVYRLCF